MPEKPSSPHVSQDPRPTKIAVSDRDQRRADALRANLRRRKAQSRDRLDTKPVTDPAD
jgi:hypothetical protein